MTPNTVDMAPVGVFQAVDWASSASTRDAMHVDPTQRERQTSLPTNPDDFHPIPPVEVPDASTVPTARPPTAPELSYTARLRSRSTSLWHLSKPSVPGSSSSSAGNMAEDLAARLPRIMRAASQPLNQRRNSEAAATTLDEAEAQHVPDAKGKGKVKGMIRRASVSLRQLVPRRTSIATSTGEDHHTHRRLLRSSHGIGHQRVSTSLGLPEHDQVQLHPNQDSFSYSARAYTAAAAPSRPATSHSSTWKRLRQAASFRHSRVFDVFDLPTPHHRGQQPYNATSPVPGSAANPPVIPRNTGGAARAAAADAAMHADAMRWLTPAEWAVNMAKGHAANHDGAGSSSSSSQQQHSNDGESGIGIAVTATESESDREKTDSRLDLAEGAAMTGRQQQRISTSSQSGRPTAEPDGIPRVDFIAHLPLELAIEILAYLDGADLATAERVSPAWRHVASHGYIWKESFLRSMTGTFATGGRVTPGSGLGIPPARPDSEWKKIYKARVELDRRWKTGSASPVYLKGHTDSIYCLQFDESKIITGSRDKTIRVWDMHSLTCQFVIGPPDVVRAQEILCDADGQPTHYAITDTSPRANASFPATLTFPGMHHNASILCLQYDDRILVTGSSDSTCIVHSIASGYRPVRRLQHHSAAVLDLVFDDRHIVTCSKDVSICVWDRETGALLRQLRGHAGPVNAVQMRGDTIVSCSGDFKVKLWNLPTGRCVREFAGHTKGLACSQFSEDGRLVASAGNDRTIRVWDANTGECVREVAAHTNLVRSLHIDSVSGRLVSGSYDTDMMVFDMESGRQLLHFPRWHASWVLSAKSDYRRIISTGQDPKILVMDFGKGVEGIELLESCERAAVVPEA